jgi:hypothetical protein
MALSWNEIKDRALAFSKEWEGTHSEEADAKPFLVDFFNVFGLNQRKVAAFEHKVKKLGDGDGYIDMLWKGWLLIEMKSKGKDLSKAYGQAKGYIHGLHKLDIPKYVLVCDFETFRLYDLEETGEEEYQEFKLDDFVNHVELFGFIAGYQKKVYREEDPVNVKAAELMGKLHDRLKEIGYEGHSLEVYLVRLLFCLFAEDTNIFNKQQFEDFIKERTSEDGSDLAAKIQEIFQVLNTPLDKRFKNLDEQLNAFPFVGGKLFQEILPVAHFDAKMRQILLECCYLDWSKISPAIFGSMFQSVMDPKERRNLGAHYTSEKNILKLIKPLFLDELWTEFESIKTNKAKLNAFHERLSKLKFLDPACGCGNFLVITYRELRLLELAVLERLYGNDRVVVELSDVALLDVDMMAGIEYEEFPARIAEVAMWLMDHQMNLKMSMEFGQYFARLPLIKSANIVHANALRIEWNDVVSKNDLNYILGNPPFIGSKWMSQDQRDDFKQFTNVIDNFGILDYVSGWYIKSAMFIQNSNIKVAFVSTNSITQGEQAGTLWNALFANFKIKIHFAYRTFNWKNEAKNNAAVHVVIVGFGSFDVKTKTIYEFDKNTKTTLSYFVKNISPYLFEGNDFAVVNRSKPICNVPILKTGNKPIDGGNFIFNEDEYLTFIKNEPESKPFIKSFLGAEEFINGKKRFILWLKGIDPGILKRMPLVIERINRVKTFRESSSSLPTKKLALTPTLYHTECYPEKSFLIIPQVSSERRLYIPIGFLEPGVVCSDKLRILENATLFQFGILVSIMHMTWMKTVTGRLKSDFQYSVLTVYNNYPWPETPSEKQIKAIETAAQKVLDARAEFPTNSLADLYDPLTMPPALVKAHNELDKAVDLAYRPQAFTSEANRMVFLFELYEKYTADLFTKEPSKGIKAKSTSKGAQG